MSAAPDLSATVNRKAEMRRLLRMTVLMLLALMMCYPLIWMVMSSLKPET